MPDLTTPTSDHPSSSFKLFWETAFFGVIKALSDTYALKILFLSFLLKRANKDVAQLTANTEIIAFINLLVIAFSPLFMIMRIVANLAAERATQLPALIAALDAVLLEPKFTALLVRLDPQPVALFERIRRLLRQKLEQLRELFRPKKTTVPLDPEYVALLKRLETPFGQELAPLRKLLRPQLAPLHAKLLTPKVDSLRAVPYVAEVATELATLLNSLDPAKLAEELVPLLDQQLYPQLVSELATLLNALHTAAHTTLRVNAAFRENILNIRRAGQLISIPLASMMMIIFGLSGFILEETKQNPESTQLTKSFLQPYMLAIPFIFINEVAVQILSGLRAGKVLIFGTFSLFITLLSAFLLGPIWGTRAVLACYMADSIATSIFFNIRLSSHVLPIQSPTSHLRTLQTSFLPIQDWEKFQLWLEKVAPIAKEIIHSGAPTVFVIGSEIGFDFCLALTVGKLPKEARDAYAVMTQVQAANLLLSLHIAISGMISFINERYKGEAAGIRARKTAFMVSIIFCIIIPLVLGISPEILIDTFKVRDPETQSIIKADTPWFSLSSFCFSLTYTTMFQMRALGDDWEVCKLRAMCLALGLFVATFLGLGRWGLSGVIAGMVFGEGFSFIALMLSLWRQTQAARSPQTVVPRTEEKPVLESSSVDLPVEIVSGRNSPDSMFQPAPAPIEQPLPMENALQPA